MTIIVAREVVLEQNSAKYFDTPSAAASGIAGHRRHSDSLSRFLVWGDPKRDGMGSRDLSSKIVYRK
jgi:hypothetical protein